ncbi:purine phosphorylase [Amycolatopsis sp. NPDC058340]|uniref:5'-methylthioadenosine/S-adenosylhomocysteine nucleosidase family protein n=1 Tax=Amycolatopsis sp. NPDC058340 TaxID=3346453 RepID=UPI00365588D1
MLGYIAPVSPARSVRGKHCGEKNRRGRMIVILTALESEYAAVRARLKGLVRHRHSAGTLFEIGEVPGHPGCKVATAVVGMGNLSAAALTERAIAEFEPSTVIFSGVAGGLRDWLRLGDVVVATKVYAYQGGRSEDAEFLARPRAWEIPHGVDQIARSLAREEQWTRSEERRDKSSSVPKVWFEPIAAGDVVLNSRTSDLAQQLRRNYNDAIAVEMESAGFASAGHLNERVPAVTIRGISDLAGGAKDRTDAEGWQDIAAANAAEFAIAVAAELADEHEDGQGGWNSPRRAAAPSSSKFVARDNARVGQQIGTNHGDTTIGMGDSGRSR